MTINSLDEILRRAGLPGNRSPSAEQSVESQIVSLTQKAFFHRAVVIEVLNDLSLLKDDQWKKIKSPSQEGLPKDVTDSEKVPDILNSDALKRAPRDSVVVRLVGTPTQTQDEENSDGQGVKYFETIVCYPFFSSHLSLPIKVGEHVWVFFEEGIALNSPVKATEDFEAWWLTRIVGPNITEDPNYSHYDRRYDAAAKEVASGRKFFKPEAEDDPEAEPEDYDDVPSFFNGSEQNEDERTFTLRYREEYEDYFQAWAGKDNFVIEPVPRFTKRPGDLVLQGSHNSTIVLGSDRGWKHDDRPTAKGTSKEESATSNAKSAEPLAAGLGSIDLVTGRGRMADEPAAFEDTDPEVGTEPLVIKNSRESYETNKNPGVKEAQKDDKPFGLFNSRAHAAEGDPDFVNDSSRIYITMKSNPDDQFALLTKNIPTVISSKKLEDKTDTASIVVKSDEIRIVARTQGLDSQKDAEPATTREVEGSIRIIKEGKLDDNACAIYLLPDGTIQISGKRIDFGREKDTDGGKADAKKVNDGLTPALGEHNDREPYMRYSDFAVWADGLIDAINTAFETDEASLKSVGTKHMALAKAVAPGGFQALVGPNPGLAGAGATGENDAMSHAHAGDKSAIEEFKSDKDAMKKIRSERIYGE